MSIISVQFPLFNSRFYKDFVPVSQLGKGGFGVVFEAKHKIDGRNYAVRRVAMSTMKEDRKKMEREVTCLFGLKHSGIVRYYSAWIENPPPGWQDDKDQELGFMFSKMEEDTTTNDSLINHQDDDNTSGDSLISFRNDGSERKAEEKITSALQRNYNEEEDTDVEMKSLSSESERKRSRRNSGEDFYAKKLKTFIYVKMDLCKKTTLKDWIIDPKSMKQDEWWSIFRQILCAVEYLHGKNFIHRDLKPSNIFFAMNGTVKIGDFGLIKKILEEISIGNDEKPTKRIKHTIQVGTLIYMSPEQIKNEQYDHKVDIFSLGLILYELLETFKTDSERITKLVAVRRKKFRYGFQEIYMNECKIIMKLLSKKPEDRPEAKEILEEMFQNYLKKPEPYCQEHPNWLPSFNPNTQPFHCGDQNDIQFDLSMNRQEETTREINEQNETNDANEGCVIM